MTFFVVVVLFMTTRCVLTLTAAVTLPTAKCGSTFTAVVSLPTARCGLTLIAVEDVLTATGYDLTPSAVVALTLG